MITMLNDKTINDDKTSRESRLNYTAKTKYRSLLQHIEAISKEFAHFLSRYIEVDLLLLLMSLLLFAADHSCDHHPSPHHLCLEISITTTRPAPAQSDPARL